MVVVLPFLLKFICFCSVLGLDLLIELCFTVGWTCIAVSILLLCLFAVRCFYLEVILSHRERALLLKIQLQLLKEKVASELLWCGIKIWSLFKRGHNNGENEKNKNFGKRDFETRVVRFAFIMACSVPLHPSEDEKESFITIPMMSTNRRPQGRLQPNCHIAWIDEMIPDLLAPDMKQKLFKGIVVKTLDWITDSKDIIVAASTTLNTRLMLAAFNAYLSNYTEALEWMSEATKSLEGMAFECDTHSLAYKYLIGANVNMIEEMMHVEAGINVIADTREVSQFLPNTFDLENDKFQAVLAVSKGMLAFQMRCEDSQLSNFKTATILDGQTAEWHRLLYKGMRSRRRKMYPGSCPSLEEIEAITKAYDLEPNCCLNQTHYACMLDEKMKGRRDFLIGETKEGIAEEVIELMLKAIEKNSEDRWAHIRLAEIYGYGDYPHLDTKNGEKLFEECEERWPDSSMVLHKFGKYYQKHNNWIKALEYYRRGLDADVDNFPCLMDYLKCIANNLRDEEQLLILIDQCIPKTITRGYWDIIGNYTIDVNELITLLSRMLPDEDSDYDIKKKRAIKNLIDELRFSGNERPVRVPAYHQYYYPKPLSSRIRSSSVCSLDSVASSDSYATAKSFWSIATSAPSSSPFDNDNNWRNGTPLEDPRGIFSGYEQQPKERFDYVYLPPPPGAYRPPYNASARGPTKKSEADSDNDWRR
ncbi:hypothetical protein Ocin01_05249 [Orchesella cincta]|uniref:Uncharacterized protein n=1 Tax=Orchesella cincta TaxID=48709 RepID=A0A1D2N885_ORCCI|nr:hypothetical protein Ocin01_05249 [Orchesella cincta]